MDILLLWALSLRLHYVEAVAALELDIAVFCEIGMDHVTYLLAHSRIAHRSVMYWGHGVTSGIPAVGKSM